MYLSKDDQDLSELKKEKTGDIRSLKFLLKFARPFWGKIALGISFLFCESFMAMGLARITGEFVDKALIPKDLNFAIKFGFLIIAIQISSIFLGWIGKKFVLRGSSLVILEMRKKLFCHFQNLPLSYFDKTPMGRVITRVTHDVEGLELFFTSTLGRLLSSLFMISAAVIMMLMTNLKLGAFVILSIIPAVVILVLTKKPVKNVNREMSKTSSQINSKLSEYIDGIDVIRSYGLEKWSFTNYKESVKENVDASLRSNLLNTWSRPLVTFLCSVPLLVLVWFGGSEVLSGAMSAGIFVAFVRYSERFYFPIIHLFREIHVIFQAFTSAERVANFLDEQEEDALFITSDKKVSSHKFEGKIDFSNVWMSYVDDQYVLKGIDFHINKGQRVGFVGPTGCGKTTVISLLSRLYEFQKGEIKIDGINIRDFDRNELRSHIGIVSQDVVIFNGTLLENLSLDKTKKHEEILNYCKLTGLYEVMNKSSLTFDTVLLEGGSNLSVGQRQLISLTRVFISNPTILILDEATANIDPELEKVIQTATSKIMKGRTSLVIAHRLETILESEKLIVFDSGVVVEQGSPSELLNQNGKFKGLYDARLEKSISSDSSI